MIHKIDELRYLTPLYLNGTLSQKKRQEFEDYLNEHPESRREITEFSEIKSFYDDKKHEPVRPSDVIYQRILRNIQADTKPKPASIRWDLWDQVTGFFRVVFTSPRVSWAVVAVQLAIILVLAFTLPRGDRFRTLSLEYTTQGNGIKINIVFDNESRETEIRHILNKFEANIINGPSYEGLYVIQVNKDRDIEQILVALRKTKIVIFAEKAF